MNSGKDKPISENVLRMEMEKQMTEEERIVYFLNKHDEKIDFIKTNLFKFSVGFVSGVLTTVIATLILRLL